MNLSTSHLGHLARSVLGAAIGMTFTGLARGEVFIVDAAGAGDFTAIQPAIDNAQDGDLLLVRGGNYQGFRIDGKSLFIASLPDQTGEVVRIVDTVDVRLVGPSLAAGLSYLELQDVRLGEIEGSFTIQNCSLTGNDRPALNSTVISSFPGGSVSLNHSAFRVDAPSRAGVPAISIAVASTSIFQCSAFGADAPTAAGPGGAGIVARAGTVFMSDGFARGGEDAAGVHAPSIRSTSPASVVVLDVTTPDGIEGPNIVELDGTARRLFAISLQDVGQPYQLIARGVAGDRVLALVSKQPASRELFGLGGVLGVGLPFTVRELGVLPASGTRNFTFPQPPLTGENDTFWIQTVHLPADGSGRKLGGVRVFNLIP